MMSRTFWKGRRVFLTGHTGFKGSWLSIWLKQLGAELTGFALPPSTVPNLFEMANVADGMTSMTGDIRDAASLEKALRKAQPEIVIHMAAQAIVRESYADPVATYATNVMGLVHLFEAIRKTPGVKSVVNVTSDKCYENREWVWSYREHDAMGGYDPYSSSKGCAELVTAAYRRSFFHPEKHNEHGVAVATARAGNVIGGGDWAADRLIPDIIRGIAGGHVVKIRNPRAVRPWQHVLEPLSGYLLLAEKLHDEGPAFAESWNFGPFDDDASTVQWIVERIAGAWGEDCKWSVESSAEDLHEAHSLKLDCSKARSILGWRPVWSLSETLAKIVEWHKAAAGGANVHQMTIEQITSYQAQRKGLLECNKKSWGAYD